MKALVSPNEVVLDPNTGAPLGQRVAQVLEESFPVAPPLFWVPCGDEVNADQYYYDPADETVKLIPEYIEPQVVQPIQTGAEEL